MKLTPNINDIKLQRIIDGRAFAEVNRDPVGLVALLAEDLRDARRELAKLLDDLFRDVVEK